MKIISIAVLLSALCLVGCSKQDQSIAEPEPQLVKALVISGSSGVVTKLYSGRATAGEETQLMFAVSGRVDDILVKEGQPVTKGTLLAKLNPRDYQNRYNEQFAQYDLTKVNLKRFSLLLKSATVSQSEYDQKLADFKVAESNLDTAKKALEDTFITAPYDGVIAKRYVEQYEHVQDKQPILLIQNLSTILVEVNIPEQDMSNGRKVQMTQSVQGTNTLSNAVTFATLPGKNYDAIVDEFSTSADPKTQTYKVSLIVQQLQNRTILPGMTAQVSVKFNSKNELNLAIPIEAVAIDENGKKYVWVIDLKSLKVHKQVVEVGTIRGNSIIVTQGLKPDQTIVIAGVTALQEGMKVKILQDGVSS